MNDDNTTDMVLGVYRRIYAGFLTGKRSNRVSLEAEAWFWRLHAIADDFGNLIGDPLMLSRIAAPRRSVTVEHVVRMNGELATERLIAEYTVDDEPYINIVGFQHKQPAGKNGKRIRKCPDPSGVSGESSAIQIDPGESSASLEILASHSHSHSHSQHQQHHQNHQDTNVRDADADGSLREWAADKAKRPEWLPQGKGWIRAGVWLATAQACPTVTREQFEEIIREAKASRDTLANPAGFVLARLKALAKGQQ